MENDVGKFGVPSMNENMIHFCMEKKMSVEMGFLRWTIGTNLFG